MSAERPWMPQLVELLGISETMGWPPSGEPVVVITVRPDPDSFHARNIARKKAQALRLLKDLESLLKVPVVVLLTCLASAGCSARVEVGRTNDTSATESEIGSTQISRTAVEVDLHPRSPQPVIQREPTLPPLPVTVPPEPQPVIVTGNTLIFNYRGGDTHETHIYVHKPVQRQVEQTVVIRREVLSLPPRPIDPRCEQLRREHDERVRRWKAFPLSE